MGGVGAGGSVSYSEGLFKFKGCKRPLEVKTCLDHSSSGTGQRADDSPAAARPRAPWIQLCLRSRHQSGKLLSKSMYRLEHARRHTTCGKKHDGGDSNMIALTRTVGLV